MFKGCPGRMSIGVTSREIEVIQNFPLIDELLGYAHWKVEEQPGDNVAPSLLPERQMQGLHSFFSRLLGCEASPFMAAFRLRRSGLLKIPFRLSKPVFGAIWQILPLLLAHVEGHSPKVEEFEATQIQVEPNQRFLGKENSHVRGRWCVPSSGAHLTMFARRATRLGGSPRTPLPQWISAVAGMTKGI